MEHISGNITPQDLYERLSRHPRPVVIDFWASWCGPCRMVDPLLKRLAQNYKEEVDIWKVNADDYPDLLRAYGVQGIPTLIAFRHGQEITRQVGASTIEALNEIFLASISAPPTLRPVLSNGEWLLRLALGSILLGFGWSSILMGGISLLTLLAMLGGAVILLSVFIDPVLLWKRLKENRRHLRRG